jgi:hypothetical protein
MLHGLAKVAQGTVPPLVCELLSKAFRQAYMTVKLLATASLRLTL